MYIFMRLPKTTGTTLRTLLDEVYTSQNMFAGDRYYSVGAALGAYNELTRTQRINTSLFSSNVAFGLHHRLEGNNRYVTLFSDPVDRIAAIYQEWSGRTGSDSHPVFKLKPSMSLREFVERGLCPDIDNGLVRYVSGTCATTPFGQVTEADLEIAKTNIRDHFEAFGFIENLSESLVYIGRKLNWDRVPLHREVMLSAKSTDRSVSPRLRSTLERYCRLDMELCQYAKELYEEEIARMGPDFHREVKAYDAALADLQHIVDVERSEWKRNNSAFWQIARKQAELVSRIRGALALRTRFQKLARAFGAV